MNLRILNNLEWTDPVNTSEDFAAFNIKHWLRSDVLPHVGQKRFVLVPSSHALDTAIALQQHLLYEPAMTSINGYEEDYAVEIEHFAIVYAELSPLACLLQTKAAWYSIEVRSVVNLNDFASIIPPQSAKPEMFRLKEFFAGDNHNTPYYVAYNSWHSFSFNEQSAWGVDLLISERESELILVYICEWYIAKEQAMLTNYQLDENESQIIRQFIKGN